MGKEKAITKTISFRSQLQGDILDFCTEEKMNCIGATEILVQLVASLANYREEGLRLAPEVFVCKDGDRMCSMLQGGQIVEIGTGKLSQETVKQALKKCASLAIGGWSIFFELEERQMKYGLFTAINLPLSLSPMEILIEGGDPSFPIIMGCQLAENIVELHGVSGNRLQIHFSTSKTEGPSPLSALEAFIDALSKDVDPDHMNSTRRYMRKILSAFLLRSHGTLAAVLPKRRSPPSHMRDGVLLAPPFDIANRIINYESRRTDEGIVALISAGSFVEGMMMSDGITLFRSDATVVGYNIFLKGKHNLEESAQVLGGARRRTFVRLCEMVPKVLNAAFIQSHDGQMDFKG